MLKEDLIEENKLLKQQLETLQCKYDKAILEIENLENLKEINIQLQIDNELLKRQNKDLDSSVINLEHRVETYEKVFEVLNKVD